MKHKCSKWLCFVGVFLVAGCARKPSVPSDSAVFRDVAAQSGITFRHDNGARGDHRFIEVLPGGVGVIDFDGDGRRDLVFVQSGPSTTDRSAFLEPTVRIYRNMGDFRFSEATRELGLEGDYGYGQGVAVADVDGDGWSDLLVTSLRGNRLFLNRSGKRFEDATKSWGLERLHSTGYATSAVFGDIDHDGRPDLFVCYYAPWSEDREIACRTAEFPDYCPPDRYPPDTNQLFRNTGRGFVDVSASAGIQRTPGRSLVASLRDLDGDGNTDILVGTDLTGNQVWLGNGKGRFREAGSEMGLAVRADGQRMASMGIASIALGDDDSESLFVTDFSGSPDALFRPIGPGVFEDVSASSGVAAPTLPWVSFGAAFLDFDNDAMPDLAVANGHVTEYADRIEPGGSFLQPQLLFRGGPGGKFELLPTDVAPDLAVPALGRGVVAADLNDDGRMDLVVVRQNATPLVLRNRSNSPGNWIGFEFKGAAPWTDAFHAKVTVHTRTGKRFGVVEGGGSYLSASDRRVHFGLGPVEAVDKVVVHWPDGRTTELAKPATGRWNRIEANPTAK